MISKEKQRRLEPTLSNNSTHPLTHPPVIQPLLGGLLFSSLTSGPGYPHFCDIRKLPRSSTSVPGWQSCECLLVSVFLTSLQKSPLRLLSAALGEVKVKTYNLQLLTLFYFFLDCEQEPKVTYFLILLASQPIYQQQCAVGTQKIIPRSWYMTY